MTKAPQYLTFKRQTYYFTRRVPSGLQHHYTTNRIVVCLRTRSRNVALKQARRLAGKLDEHWDYLRWQDVDVPMKRFLHATHDAYPAGPTLRDAQKVYEEIKGKDRDKVFFRTTERAIEYACDTIGNKPLKDYCKADATRVRDRLKARGLSWSSVRRMMATVRSVINFAIDDYGLDIQNPFNGIYIGSHNLQSPRKTIPTTIIKKIQDRCVSLDDDRRWLIALVSDTGMRLAEAAGLLVSDFHLDGDHPYVEVSPHPWRRLKNIGSHRIVPLVGASLWAAERVVKNQSKFAFPRYCSSQTCKAGAASATLNKWIKSMTGETYVMHGFRHSLRDRLRAIECPSDIIDQVGGWTTSGVGQTYGDGYPLSVTAKWVTMISMLD